MVKFMTVVPVLGLLLLASCSEDKGGDGFPDMEPLPSDNATITAMVSDGLCDSWNTGDVISLIHDGHVVGVTIMDAGPVSALQNVIGVPFTENNPLYGIYPAESVVSCDPLSVSVYIPSEQSCGNRGYDERAAVSAARSVSDLLCFYIVGGGIHLKFQTEGVTKVELESVDGYALAGVASLSFDDRGLPAVGEIEEAKSIVTLSAADNSGFIPGHDYYISTLPCDVYGGYRLSIFKDGLVAHYYGVHQTVERAGYIVPDDLNEGELIFDDPGAPLVEEDRPQLDTITNLLLRQYMQNPTEENKRALMDQMGICYDKVVARKKAKLRELEREAKTQNLIDEMQAIVDEMVENREIRLEQQFLRLIDPRNDDNPYDAWMVLRGASATNAYIAYAPVTNGEYGMFDPTFVYDEREEKYPVVNITIEDATAYCDWLMTQDRLHIYRLPTDEEWTLAAGHMPKDVNMNAGHVESGLTAVDIYGQTTGACGGIDFWGNCWEWTSTTAGAGTYIVKGGSWDSDRDDCRSEKSDVVRNGTQGYANVGFRVVRTDR